MVNASQPFQWIPYFDVSLKSTQSKTVVAQLILPIDDENQLAEIMASKKFETHKDGGLSISFVYKNQPLKYIFKNKKSGLVLDE